MALSFGGRRKILFICIGVFVFLLLASSRHQRVRRYLPPNFGGYGYDEELPPQSGMTGGSLPGPGPSYERFNVAERALPQHNLDLPFPEGRHGKYVKFSEQIRALGWNNVLNEVLLCAHVAWRAKRAYVFQDYYWKPEYYPWRVPDWPWPQNPLSTLISGPVAGGPWEEGDDTPRSVREEWFAKVCPPEDTEIIDTDVGKEPVRWKDGQTMMDHWVKLVSESKKRCVEIVPSLSGKDGYPQIFDLWMIGDGRSLSVWPEFKKSPISRLLGASPLVLTAVEKNQHLFYPPTPRDPNNLKFNFAYDPYPHMMAVHIRRGDYLQACEGLANWNSTFYGWNLLPELPDPFHAPPLKFEGGHAPPETHAAYKERCLPTNEYILDKIATSKAAWEANGAPGEVRRLDVLYVMTNAKNPWIDEFKQSLKKSNAGWKKVVTSKDMSFDFEETGVNMAVDMELARKAAVYIGNGWSSMTSNILHRRLVDEKEPLANRFW